MDAKRPFVAELDPAGGPAGAVDRAVGAGYTGVALTARWAAIQPAGPASVEFAALDKLVKLVRSKGLAVTLLLDHVTAPGWVDAAEFGMRDGAGRPLLAAAGGGPLLTMNAKQVRDWVGAFVQICAAHYQEQVAEYAAVGPHVTEAATYRHGGPALDHSARAAEAYHGWLHGRYVDIRTLNETWESSFKAWDEVPVGEGNRKHSQADFHHFRTSTLVSWTTWLAKTAKAGFPGAVVGFRSAGGKIRMDLGALAFDLGRYLRVVDAYVIEDVTDPFTLAMVRSGADLWKKSWAVSASAAGALKVGAEEGAADAVLGWSRQVYNQGGSLRVRQPAPETVGPSLEAEVRKILPIPPGGPRQNRRAVYVSAAEAMFWDGTDEEAARNAWAAQTDGGKKTSLDVISDGMFVGSPDVLKQYTAGIEIPFGKIIARDAHQALLNAKRSGIRLSLGHANLAATQDEYGRPQVSLAV